MQENEKAIRVIIRKMKNNCQRKQWWDQQRINRHLRKTIIAGIACEQEGHKVRGF